MRGGGRRRRAPWSHDDPSTGFRRRLGLTYDWDLVGNETLPAALLQRAAAVAEAFDIRVPIGTFQEPLNLVEYGQFDYYEPHCDVSCERSGPSRAGGWRRCCSSAKRLRSAARRRSRAIAVGR